MSENQLSVIVGENISAQRKRLGISQKELAAKLEISQDAMARMEKGKIAPKMGRLQDIADNLQCSVPYLFHNEHEFTHERAEIIAGIIKALPPQGQELIVDFVASAVNLMIKK